MSTDLLLIYPPYDVKFYQPVGLAQLAGYLTAKGYRVKVLDAVALGYNLEQVHSYIKECDTYMIGVSIPFSEMIESGKQTLIMCREYFPNTLLICGGYHAKIRPLDVVNYCDLVVTDEGEEVMCDLFFKYFSGHDIYMADGITFKSEYGKHPIISNPPREPLKDINFSFPAWNLMPFREYNMTMYLSTKERAFPLQTGYGCPYECTFCCNSKLKEPVRYKSIDHVVAEIKNVIDNYGVKAFHIWDETFTLDKSRVKEFCLKVKDLDIHWSAQTRAGLLNKDLLTLMKKAGCVRISIGVESGNANILKSINKNISLQKAIETIRLIKEAGMVSYAGFMIGHPDDTIETVWDTINFSKELNSDFVSFRIAIPYPGCVFHDIALQKGRILTDDLSKYRDDNVVYIPEGLEGYDLKKLQKAAYDYFNA